MIIDKTDRKLIHQLYHNFREPLTKIAKTCNLSREQVEYRIKKYENEGLIKKFFPTLNYPALGYHEFVIIRLKASEKNQKSLFNELTKIKNCISVLYCFGKYNLHSNFVFKDKDEFEEVFYGFLKTHKPEISEYNILFVSFLEMYPLKFIKEDIAETLGYRVIGPLQKAELSQEDIKVLRALNGDGRARLIDISKKTGISSDLLVYKIRKYRETGLIQGIRMQLDLTKIGLNLAIYAVKLDEYTEKTRKSLIEFSKNHKYINAIIFGISEYNCHIQIIYETDKTLRDTITDIEKRFSQDYTNSEIFLLAEESEVNTFPM